MLSASHCQAVFWGCPSVPWESGFVCMDWLPSLLFAQRSLLPTLCPANTSVDSTLMCPAAALLLAELAPPSAWVETVGPQFGQEVCQELTVGGGLPPARGEAPWEPGSDLPHTRGNVSASVLDLTLETEEG